MGKFNVYSLKEGKWSRITSGEGKRSEVVQGHEKATGKKNGCIKVRKAS